MVRTAFLRSVVMKGSPRACIIVAPWSSSRRARKKGLAGDTARSEAEVFLADREARIAELEQENTALKAKLRKRAHAKMPRPSE